MRYYVNMTKAVINIGGHTVIAPTKAALVDPEIRGIKDLVVRGLLVETAAPAGTEAAPPGAGESGGAMPESKEPSTVKDLKAWLDNQGAQYSSTASKAELQGLYEALKASLAEQGGTDSQTGAGSEGE